MSSLTLVHVSRIWSLLYVSHCRGTFREDELPILLDLLHATFTIFIPHVQCEEESISLLSKHDHLLQSITRILEHRPKPSNFFSKLAIIKEEAN